MHDFEKLQKQASFFQSPLKIASELPLLEKMCAKDSEVDLSEHSFLFVQHFLAALPARLDLMVKQKLNKKKAWFLDIPYSTNKDVRKRIIDQFPGRVPEVYSNPFGHYCSSQKSRLEKVVNEIINYGEVDQLVVVDDGAYFAKYLFDLLNSDPKKARLFEGTRLVEQTTRGHNFLDSQNGKNTLKELKINAVSVACADTKKNFEAPFIGVAIARSVISKLDKGTKIPKRALIIGFGSVGSATAFALRSKFGDMQIDIVEVDEKKQNLAREYKFLVHDSLPNQAGGYEYDLVVGCTGQCSFRPSDRGILLNEAVLASGSSAAVEFETTSFITLAEELDDKEFRMLTKRDKSLPLHTDITFEHGPENKKFTLLNASFPLNFQGTLGVVPTELIEPTHCLLHAATLEVINMPSIGLRELSKKADEQIHELAKGVISVASRDT